MRRGHRTSDRLPTRGPGGRASPLSLGIIFAALSPHEPEPQKDDSPDDLLRRGQRVFWVALGYRRPDSFLRVFRLVALD